MIMHRVFAGALAALLAVGSTSAQPILQGVPGYHPAADNYLVMMGQEYPVPSTNFGDVVCGPHWYDFLIEGAYLTRDDSGRTVNLTSNTIRGAGPPDVVLGSDSIDFGYEAGLRAFARYQIGAVYNIEAGFLGAIDWSERAVVTNANDSLYSVFSDFGNTPNGGFISFGTGQAFVSALTYLSELDSVEINMRRTWGTNNGRVFGSWLWGVRYVRLREDMLYSSQVQDHVDPIGGGNTGDSSMLYTTGTENDLVGFQLGGELTGCIMPGLLIGVEYKGGVYGNDANQDTVISSTGLVANVIESADSEDVAFVGELSLFMTYQIHPLVKFRGGYTAMYIDGLALATENFNPESPFGGTARAVSINDNGNTLHHGGLLGLEIGW